MIATPLYDNLRIDLGSLRRLLGLLALEELLSLCHQPRPLRVEIALSFGSGGPRRGTGRGFGGALGIGEFGFLP
jgi:hypothetical protein